MRIRSIKPEFWTDEKMSAVCAETALLAIGLLNYADDEGLFNAHPRLIQASLMPLRECSGNVPGMLTELSNIGWIERRTAPDGRQLGAVLNFEFYQTISHPQKSRFREAWEAAGNVPGTFPEPSGSFPGGTGIRNRYKEQVLGTGIDPAGAGSFPASAGPNGKSSRKPKPGSIHPSELSEPFRSRLPAVGALLRRLPSTRWSADELTEARAAGLDRLDDDDFLAQLEALRPFYAASILREKDFRRRDVLRLLKNWPGELDKARAWIRDHQDGVTKI